MRAVIAARACPAGQQAVKQLSANPSTPVKALQLDVQSAASIDALAAAVASQYPQQIDVVIQNAGVLYRDRWDAEEFNATVATNFSGTVQLTRKLLPHLPDSALVVLVSSQMGQLDQLTPDYASLVQQCSSIEEIAERVQFREDSPMKGTSFAPSYCVSKVASFSDPNVHSKYVCRFCTCY